MVYLQAEDVVGFYREIFQCTYQEAADQLRSSEALESALAVLNGMHTIKALISHIKPPFSHMVLRRLSLLSRATSGRPLPRYVRFY